MNKPKTHRKSARTSVTPFRFGTAVTLKIIIRNCEEMVGKSTNLHLPPKMVFLNYR